MRSRRAVVPVLGVVVAVAVAVAASGPPAAPVAPASTTRPAKPTLKFPCEVLGNIDKDNFKASDVVYHPARKTLFAVGDLGEIREITTDGKFLRKVVSKKWRDYEGITHDPATGLLYVAVEGEEKILEVDPRTLETKREFAVPRTFEGKTLMHRAGNGIEGITFVPNPKHPEGGTFYVSNQSHDLKSTNDISAVFEVEVPLKSVGKEPRILRYFSIGVIDLAGLYYDRKQDLLYVLSDATDTLWEVTTKGKIVRGYIFPGNTQEGIAVDDQGCVYIAQDWGGIIKLKWLRPATQPARTGREQER